MTNIDIIVFSVLICFGVFSIYLFYLAYNHITSKKEDDLGILIMIFSILYILFKLNLNFKKPTLLLNLPLIIAYYKKDKLSIFFSSILLVIYYYFIYKYNVYLLIVEYVILFFVKDIKYVIPLICLFYMPGTLIVNISDRIMLFISSLIIINLFNFSEKIINLNMSLKEIEKNKQIHNAIFRIAHEIKNPIAVCKGYLDMFDENNRDHLRYIPIIKNEINKTLILLEDFLMINRVKLNKDYLDINMLLNDSLASLKPLFKEKNIEILSNISDDEVFVYGDYDRLNEVITNVLKNSVEALKDDPLIKVWSYEKNNNAYIFIKDNGEGIKKELLDKIKEPFFTTKTKGTGLGVPLSEKIVKAHDGSIDYFSKEGEYTLVKICLPLSN